MIAAQFTGSAYATYSAAAEQVRLPYWDWSEKSGACLPAIIMEPTVSVIRPGVAGVATGSTIQNPLFQYNFQSPATLAQYFEGPNASSPWPVLSSP